MISVQNATAKTTTAAIPVSHSESLSFRLLGNLFMLPARRDSNKSMGHPACAITSVHNLWRAFMASIYSAILHTRLQTLRNNFYSQNSCNLQFLI